MLAKTVKLATAWREANSSRDNRNITSSTTEGRPPQQQGCQKWWRLANNSTSIIRDTNSSIWTPTAQ
jgi:predicted secreted protein